MRLITRVVKFFLRVILMAPFFGIGFSEFSSSGAAYASSAVRQCTYKQLEVAVAWGPGGIAGTEASPFLIANVGRQSCFLIGYPQLTVYTGLPTAVKLNVLHSSSQIFARTTPAKVIVNPGQVASFGLSYSDAYDPKNNKAKDCDVIAVYVTLPVKNSGGASYEASVNFNVCQSNRTVEVTAIEKGPTPKIVR